LGVARGAIFFGSGGRYLKTSGLDVVCSLIMATFRRCHSRFAKDRNIDDSLSGNSILKVKIKFFNQYTYMLLFLVIA